MLATAMDLLSQIATFVRVVDGKSLSAAARSQHLSLPAVSRQLRALEDDLGVTLIARTTRSLRLTEAGQRWYEHGTRILAEVEAARSSVAGEHTIAGRLTVSAGITIGLHFATPVIARLLVMHPRLEVDLRLEDRIADLVTDGVDVALRGGILPPDSTSIVARPIGAFSRVLVAAPAYLKKRRTPREPTDLARHCFLVQLGPAGAVDELRLLDGEGTEQVVRVSHRFRCNAPIALRDAAREGIGIASLGEWLVAEDLQTRRLVRVLPDWKQPPTSVWALHARTHTTPRVRAFLDALTSYTSIGSIAETSRPRRAKARP